MQSECTHVQLDMQLLLNPSTVLFHYDENYAGSA